MRFPKFLIAVLASAGLGYAFSGRAIAQLPTPLQSNPDQMMPMQSAPEQPIVLVGEGALTDDEDQDKTEDGIPYDYFAFNGVEGDRITITLESDDFDTILGLFLITEEGAEPLAVNDNSSETTTNSRISAVLPSSGVYSVLVTTVDRRLGDYAIALEGLSAR